MLGVWLESLLRGLGFDDGTCGVDDLRDEFHCFSFCMTVDYLRFDGDVGVLGRDIVGINVGAGGFEVVVERQRDVQGVHGVEENVAIDSAMVWVPVLVMPDEREILAEVVAPVVVHLDRDDVSFLTEIEMRSELVAKRQKASTVAAEVHAVDVDVSDLAYRLEFDEDFLVGFRFREREVLSVPDRAAPLVAFAVVSALAHVVEGIDIVEGVGATDAAPATVVEVGGFGSAWVGLDEFPIRVEIEFLALAKILSYQAGYQGR